MSPALSVVVTAFNAPELLEGCLAALERQTRQADAEVIVVGDWGADGNPPPSLKQRHPDVAWVCAPGGSTVPQLRGMGLAHSRAEIVALVEDDCVADGNWCAAVLEAHRENYAAVGGAVEPGPYRRALDWAVYLCEFSRFMLPLQAEEPPSLAINNVSYKRQALAERLAARAGGNATMDAHALYDYFLHQQMRQAGQRLKSDPAIIVHNVNSWTLAHVTVVPFHHGRGYAAMRVAGLPWWRRLPYAGMAVLVPPLQVWRIARRVAARRRLVGRAGTALPWVMLFSICWASGEFAGYLRGPGNSLERWRRLDAGAR